MRRKREWIDTSKMAQYAIHRWRRRNVAWLQFVTQRSTLFLEEKRKSARKLAMLVTPVRSPITIR